MINRREWPALLVSAAGGALALALEHVGFWGWETFWEKPHGRLRGYVTGSATLWGAFTAWAALTGDWRAWRAYTAILGTGGGTILLAWLIRDERAHRADWQNEAGGLRLQQDVRPAPPANLDDLAVYLGIAREGLQA